MKLNCTVRHINRMIKGYLQEGKSYFAHGNRGRKPVHTLDSETVQLIRDLYLTKYYDANFTHYSELLKKHENIIASPSTIRSILMKDFILSPKARRSTKKRIKKLLKEAQKDAKSKKEAEKIHNAIIAIEDAHPRRPRCLRRRNASNGCIATSLVR